MNWCRILITQIIGCPLYIINKEWYYTYMSLTKQSFGLLAITISDWWSPTKIRISGDESVRGQIRLGKDGLLECDFPERIVLIANHQVFHTISYSSLWCLVTNIYWLSIAILRLAVPLVDRIYCSHARRLVHHLEGITQMGPRARLGHAILWLHLFGQELEKGSRAIQISSEQTCSTQRDWRKKSYVVADLSWGHESE